MMLMIWFSIYITDRCPLKAKSNNKSKPKDSNSSRNENNNKKLDDFNSSKDMPHRL